MTKCFVCGNPKKWHTPGSPHAHFIKSEEEMWEICENCGLPYKSHLMNIYESLGLGKGIVEYKKGCDNFSHSGRFVKKEEIK